MIPKSLVLVEDLNDAEIFKAMLAYIQREDDVAINAMTPIEELLTKPNETGYTSFLIGFYDYFNRNRAEGTDNSEILKAMLAYIDREYGIAVSAIVIDELLDFKDTKPDKTSLVTSLKGLYNDFTRNKYPSVGIVLDLDKSTQQERITLINNALNDAYPTAQITELTNINQFSEVTFDKGTEKEFVVNFACHFIHIAGKGELEDLLMAIKGLPSPYADCLYEGWKPCFEQKGRTLSDDKPKDDSSFINHKEMQKYYIDAYKRFDVLPRRKKRDQQNTKWDNFLKKNPQAFDFGKDEVVELKALKDFLRML